VRIGILGPLTVLGADGRPVEVTAAGPRLLLQRLAVDVGMVVSTGALIEALWPAAPPADPAGALQTVVARLRKALRADRTVLTSHPSGYALDLPREAVDAVRFEQLAAKGRTQTRAGTPAEGADTLRVALALWRGPPLADVPEAEFAIAPRTRLTELRERAQLDRIGADLAGPPPLTVDAPALVAELEELCAANPLREQPVVLLMRALPLAGRRADALQAYQRIRTRLADELGVDPGQELRAAHLAALREEAPAAVPVVAGEAGNLPARLTSFVGRETENEQVRAQLRAGRLVTLTGFGGVGKTRLAIEAATGLGLPDGSWLVELASVTDPAGLAAAVLAAFGRHGSGLLAELTGPRPTPVRPQDRLHEVLADKSLLLVLDNCEQVIDAVAELADRLLRGYAGVRILATSREPLGITGEIRYPVSPLTLPETATETAAEAGRAAAVSLFLARASAVSPGFRLDEDTVAEVVRVCRELDGIPLAIELAAARLSSLTLPQLAERIGARLRVLGKGARTANARHRTLRAALDWSWDLLDDTERVLLRRLSVFAGGADLDAISAVCGGGAAAEEVLDLLSGLVDRSLVVHRARHPVRYGLLATLREYAAERLVEAGEQDRLPAAHAGYFAAFAREAEPRLRGADQLDWLARLDREQGNLDAALGHACTAPDPAIALTLVAANMWRWSIRGQRAETQRWAAEAIRAAGQSPPAGYEREYQLCQLVLPHEHVLATARALLRRWGHPSVLAASSMGQWPAISELTDISAYFAETAAWLRAQPDPWLRATGEFSRGMVESEFTPGGTLAAERHLRAALAAFEVIGDRWGLFYASYQLSVVLETLGANAEAVALLAKAQEYATALGGADALPVPMMLVIRSAELHTKAGDFAAATAELALARQAADRTDDPVILARTLHALAELARYQGDLDEAVRLHCASVELVSDLAQRLTPADGLAPQFIARAHSSLARVLGLRGDHTEARELHGRAIALLADTIDAPVRAGVLECAAQWCVTQGHAEAAAVLIGAAQALRGADLLDLPELVALRERCRVELGEAGFQLALDRGATLPAPETVALPG
jgi:predicted ATPase/DNA-binding winged helix-turn-helix (wHTH) protein